MKIKTILIFFKENLFDLFKKNYLICSNENSSNETDFSGEQ